MENREVRLNKYLARCGIASRRECDKIIASGKISINGDRVTELGVKVTESDIVKYNGEVVTPASGKEYYAYNKYVGTVVTASDPHGRETVYDAIKSVEKKDISHLKYIGRLDMNSEGLLLFTNDGDLIHALTHPKFHIKKVYDVKIDKELKKEEIEKMVNVGILDEDQLLRAGSVKRIENVSGYIYSVELYEGKNRQIRRMFNRFGYKVLKLKRMQFSSVKLRDLSIGRIRTLTEREVLSLKNRGFKKFKS